MKQCTWTGNIPSLTPLSLALTLLFLMIPLGAVSLSAQPTLSEVLQDTSEKSTKEIEVEKVVKLEAEIPEDEFERGTPRRSVRQFLHETDEADYETAAKFGSIANLVE